MKNKATKKDSSPSQFTNLHNLEQFFNDEKTCRDFIKQRRWNNIPVCPHCGSFEPYELKDGKTYKCKECIKFFTVLTGTIFENTKIPLIKWFKALYIVTSHKKGISSIQLGKDLGLTQKTAWFVLGRIRKLAEDKTPFMLEGTIQIDETFVGGKLSNKHQSARAKLKRAKDGRVSWTENKTVVLGLVQQDGKIINKIIPDISGNSILPVMLKHVKQGSTIVTDEYKVYKRLSKLGYTHQSVQHIINEFVRDGFTTNQIEGYFSLLKRGIYGIYHKVTPKHLFRYCNEFSFRYNTRNLKENERFNVALKQIDSTRLRYAELIKAPEPGTPGKMQY